MLEDVDASMSSMKRMKSTGKLQSPGVHQGLTKCRLERKPVTLMAIELSEKKEPFHLMNMMEIKHR